MRGNTSTVEAILTMPIAIPNVEYLLNGAMYVAKREAKGEDARLTIGTTTNEAMTG